jgi:hypothetical protein
LQVTNKYMKKWWISLTINEMQIKTTLGFHLTPVRQLSSITQTNGWWGCREKEHTFGGSVN